MPMNKIPRLREPRGSVVQQVRDLFLETDFKENPEDFYEQDVEHVRQLNYVVQRCLIMHRKQVQPAAKMLATMLRWRKERRLYDLQESSFPAELSMSGGVFLYNDDKFSNRTLYLRASMCRNCAELKTTMKDYLSWLMFKLDDPVDGSTFSVILDLTNTTWNNYDLDLLMHFVNLLKDQFPVNLDYVLAINFPWILSAAWTLIKRLIPAEKRDIVQFIDSKKVFDFIERENVPDFLGGTCSRPYAFVCDQSPTSIEYLLARLDKGTNKKRLREIYQLFSDILPKDHLENLARRIESLEEIDGKVVFDENNNNNNDNNNNNNDHDEQVLKQKSIKDKQKTPIKITKKQLK